VGRRTLLKLFSIMTVTLMILMCLFPCAVQANARTSERVSQKAVLSLNCKSLRDGTVKVSLELSSGTGICGLFGELCFDDDAFLPLSCGNGESGEQDLTFSCEERQGRIIFLLDGQKNCAPDCTLASFYFKKTFEGEGSFEFSVNLIGELACFVLYEDNTVRPIDADVSDCSIKIDLDGKADGIVLSGTPQVTGISTFLKGDSIKLSMRARAPGGAHFAVGFKVFSVDLSGKSGTEQAFVCKISNGEAYTLDADIACFERMCIIITPITYNGRTVTEGDKRVILSGYDALAMLGLKRE